VEDKVKDLTTYEYSLHRNFSFKAEGICAYNVREMIASGYVEMIMPILRSHAQVIMIDNKGGFIADSIEIEQEDVEQIKNIKLVGPTVEPSWK
jgi:hypothetical protein